MAEAVVKPPGGHAIDLSADEFSAAVSAVTSAFGDPTRRDIYLFVRAGADGVTAAEVAERFDLHPNVARHHLAKLTAGRYLTPDLAPLAVGSQRPAPLPAGALEMRAPDEAAAMAESVGYDYGLAIAARMTPEV